MIMGELADEDRHRERVRVVQWEEKGDGDEGRGKGGRARAGSEIGDVVHERRIAMVLASSYLRLFSASFCVRQL